MANHFNKLMFHFFRFISFNFGFDFSVYFYFLITKQNKKIYTYIKIRRNEDLSHTNNYYDYTVSSYSKDSTGNEQFIFHPKKWVEASKTSKCVFSSTPDSNPCESPR